jgi:hypothetical protein
MSRYPSNGVERFDQQFAETESDRNDRLRRRRLKTSPEMSDLDRLHAKENEIARLMAALIRIDAINDNPACFNAEINAVCDTILRPHLAPQE